MPKFGLFTGPMVSPDKTWDGDYMTHDKSYATIYKRATDPAKEDEIVAAINMKEGQDVRKLG